MPGNAPYIRFVLQISSACWYDPLGWLFLESLFRQTEICISGAVSIIVCFIVAVCDAHLSTPADTSSLLFGHKNMWSGGGNCG